MREESRFPFTSFPEGWFAVAFSHEARIGAPYSTTHMGQKVMLVRRPDGHLLAHGLPGTHHHLIEQHGVILHFFGHQERWALPIASTDGWCKPMCQDWHVRTHPQEIIENTVDIPHFSKVHGYESIEVTSPIHMNGPHIEAGFAVTRSDGLLGKWDPTPVEMQLDVQASGVGYSRVEIWIEKLGLKVRQIVMPTPVDGDVVRFFATTEVQQSSNWRGPIAWLQHLVPRRLLTRLLCRVAAHGMAHDVQQDFTIWENKRYVSRPTLGRNDGPIGKYRKWATQFYGRMPAVHAPKQHTHSPMSHNRGNP